jgi:hypothetical protein
MMRENINQRLNSSIVLNQRRKDFLEEIMITQGAIQKTP